MPTRRGTRHTAPDDPAGIALLGEQLGDRQVEGTRDPMHGRDRGAGHIALDLREEALGHARTLGDVAQRQVARLPQGPDPGAELELRRHGPGVLH